MSPLTRLISEVTLVAVVTIIDYSLVASTDGPTWAACSALAVLAFYAWIWVRRFARTRALRSAWREFWKEDR